MNERCNSSYLSKSGYFRHAENVWEVNARKSGIHTHMMKRILEQITALLTYDSKVFILRFDLHQIEYTFDSKYISKFNLKLKKALKERYSINHMGFAWCRELDAAKGQHYHYALMLEGHKVWRSHNVIEIIEDVWKEVEGISVWRIKYHNITRTRDSAFNEAVFHLSYLAKGRDKGYRPQANKDFQTSRIKPKTNKKS